MQDNLTNVCLLGVTFLIGLGVGFILGNDWNIAVHSYNQTQYLNSPSYNAQP